MSEQVLTSSRLCPCKWYFKWCTEDAKKIVAFIRNISRNWFSHQGNCNLTGMSSEMESSNITQSHFSETEL